MREPVENHASIVALNSRANGARLQGAWPRQLATMSGTGRGTGGTTAIPHAIVLVGVVALAKADAATIGVVAPALRADLHVTDAQLGFWRRSPASPAPCAPCPLAGWWTGGTGRPSSASPWCSGAWPSVWPGFAAGLALLAVARLVSGGVATIARPVSVSLAGDLYHPHRRGRALAALDAGQAAGTGAVLHPRRRWPSTS